MEDGCVGVELGVSTALLDCATMLVSLLNIGADAEGLIIPLFLVANPPSLRKRNKY